MLPNFKAFLFSAIRKNHAVTFLFTATPSSLVYLKRFIIRERAIDFAYMYSLLSLSFFKIFIYFGSSRSYLPLLGFSIFAVGCGIIPVAACGI